MAGFDEAVLSEILSRVNIVEVISEYIPLKRAGRNFKALCPFHHEKTSSFVVSADKQIYHCFGCGAGGNVFNFLMQYERLEFPEAVELLAKKAGVLLPQRKASSGRSAALTTELYRTNELAQQFYSSLLFSADGRKAREYLAQRGISPETAKLWKLGLAPDGWDRLLDHLRQKGIPLATIEKAGLILAKDGGGYYDRFRNRIIFPVCDAKASLVGFGARVMDKSLPKYINSPETPVYRKGSILFGLSLAKDAIRQHDRIIVVEGYLDCIIPFQHGLQEIVASSGTALTPEQARLIKRYSRNVVMIFDPDTAGQAAAVRSLDIFIEEDMNVSVVTLPQGKDPDMFVRSEGIPAFCGLIDRAVSFFDYKIRFLRQKHDASRINGKAEIASEMLSSIHKVKNALIKAEYIKRLAQELGVSEDALVTEFKKIKDSPAIERFSGAKPVAAPEKANPTEKLLIKLMLEEAALVDRIRRQLDPMDFQDERAKRLVSMMFELVTQGKDCTANHLIAQLESSDFSHLICESSFLPEVDYEQKEKIVDECIVRMKQKSLMARRHRLQQEIRDAERHNDEERVNRLKHEFNHLIKRGAVPI